MGEDRTYSRTVVTVALLAEVLLGVLGTNVFRAHHPNLPSSTAYTAPQPLSTVGDSLAVEAYVDSNGRIQEAYTGLPGSVGNEEAAASNQEHAYFYNISSGNFHGQAD